ncbi:hypothetical protein AAHE18_14G102100 [Arachis hypogaea]
MKYQAHINLEFCNKSNVIKYLFKYINKGSDRVTATVGETYHVGESSQVVDEIKQYYDCRYLSPSESMWRIFAYDIHHRWPSVQRLTFHLPNQQHVVFDDADIITHVYLRNKDLLTMFTSWMMAKRRFPDGWSLTYVEYPGKFVYCSNSREWKPRQRGFSIARLSFAHPSSGELFYMRMLLNVHRGCTSFRSIRTVNGVTYDTFQEACSAMGFLIDDKEYIFAIKEVAEVASAAQLRRLLRSEKRIVINVASSGIASLLLPGGKTAHSMFNIPVELTEDTVCRIKKDSAKAEVVRLANLIIWDEAPMTNKLAFEALDRTLRDIMVSVSDRNKDLPFGGKVVILGGDFRQVLPVIPKGSRVEIVMASINSSVLWKYCKVLCLTKNMRLTMGLEQSTPQELRSFSDWILQVVEGRCRTVVSDKLFVDIPSDLIIPVLENPVEDIVNTIYPNLVQNFRDPSFFQDRAILAPTVDNV